MTEADLFAGLRDDPYPVYSRLRTHFPVFRLGRNSWVFSRYDDVMSTLTNPQQFSSSIMAGASRCLLGNDPPNHTRVRDIVARVFRQQTAQIETQVRGIAHRLAKAIPRRGSFDLMTTVAGPLVSAVIMQLLGIERERASDFRRLCDEVVAAHSGSGGQGNTEAHTTLSAFFAELVAQRREERGTDLVSALLREHLSVSDVTDLSRLILIAGNETTTNLIGNAMRALLLTPSLLERVRNDPELVPALVEETLRYDSPVQLLQRRVTQDILVDGQWLRCGDTVLVLVGAANRDEQTFSQPDKLDIERTSAEHLAFGAGPHYCIGAALARVEAACVLRALLEHRPSVWAAEDPKHIPMIDSMHLRGPRRLTLTAAEA